MDVQVERTAEALDQRDRTGLCRRLRVAGFPDQMRGKGPIDDARTLPMIAGRLANRNLSG
jgi:hypothetical protein